MQHFNLTKRAAALAAALLLVPLLAGTAAAQQTLTTTERVAVAAVVIEGNRRVTEDQILGQINIAAGDTVTAADVDRAMRRLFAMGQFSDVTVYAQSDPANPDAPATLRFVVEEQPLVAQIEFRGLQNIRASAVRDTVGLRVGRPYEPRRAAEAEAVTRQMLADRGFRVRSIEHRLEPLADRVDEFLLVFEVEEGTRVAISDIEFVGNEAFSDSRLRSVMRLKREGFLWTRPGTFDEAQLREDLRGSLPDFYARHGYIDFAVVGDSLDVDDETGKGRLVVRLAEGPQYRLAEFDVVGARRFASDDLRRYFEERRSGFLGGFGIGGGRDTGTQPGEVFDQIAFRDATMDVQRLYNNQGYLYAQIHPVVERIPSAEGGEPRVRVVWDIEEGNPASVRRVEVAGNTFTHESVIRNQIMVLPGDIYSEEMLINSYRRISGTGFFETPMPLPQIDADEETGDVDITFEVVEKQTGSVNFGTSLGGAMGLMGFLGYDQPNLFGQAKSGHLRWEFGRYSNNFEASYSDPQIAGSFLSGSVSLFSSRDRFFTFSEGQRRRTGASFRVGVPMPRDRFSRFNVGYSLSRTTYEEFDQDQAESLFSLPPGVQSTVSLGITRMALDHPLFPTVGTRLELNTDLSGGLLGGDGNFQKYTVNGAWYVPVGSLGGDQPGTRPIRFTLGLAMEAGALFGDASRFPFDRFWMGGVQFGRPLRGYEETEITPRGYIPRGASGVALSDRFGDAYARLSAEYAMRFTDNISVGVFYDAGNVWLNPREMNPTRLMRGAGIGMTLITPFGPLGLDYAYGFDKDQPGWQMHFKFGQGF
ncbi:MAG TPA: outer membrane protein assembly factor BamA [Longimicrobiales bacterium]|nr:outer membrane protein assembly factor BamA [Longimicrobiales bacterium]